MKIAPIDIAHKSFNKKMWGLDPDEVMDFLKSVADEMEAIIRDRNQLKEALREKELSILEYRERDKVLKDTITTAQKMSERIREEAEREGKLILADSNQKADLIVKEARESLKKLYREISDLQRARMQYETNLRSMIQSHLMLLEQQDRYLPKTNLPDLDFSSNEQMRPLSPALK